MLQDFWDNFLDYGQRYNLIPWGMQQMWRDLSLPRAEVEHPNYALRFLLAPQWYDKPWDALERGELPPRYTYRHFTVPKRDGSSRELAEPGVDLKAMQHNILEHLLRRAKPHHSAVGYRRGLSIADHAWAHAGARTIITADIADFFPSTKRYRVRQFWKEHRQCQTPQDVQLLTNLTTYRGSLPQGAPTSPALSNLVNREMDARLHKLAMQSGGRYTRYADDLAFSWLARPRPPADFEQTARRILREYGYRLHPQKGWVVWAREDEPEVTGVVLTRRGGVDIPAPMKEKMRALARSDEPGADIQLAGYEGYRQMVVSRGRWRLR